MQAHADRLLERGIASSQVILPYCQRFPQYCWASNGTPYEDETVAKTAAPVIE